MNTIRNQKTTSSARRRATVAAGAVALALVGTALVPAAASVAATTTAKTWTFASYNVGASGYGNYLIDGSTAASIDPDHPEKYWADMQDAAGHKRSTSVVSRIKGAIDFGGTAYAPDVVAVQESSSATVTVGGVNTTQRENLDARLNPDGPGGAGYAQAVDFSKYNGVGDPIVDAGVSRTRTVAKASHIYYNEETLVPIASGTSLGADLINPSYRANYLAALGQNYPDGKDFKEKTFPWVVLKSTSGNTTEANRYLIVASVHSTVAKNYADGLDSTADFYNGEIARGLAKKLEAYSAAGNADGVVFEAGAPVVIMGDMNSYFRTSTGSFPSGATTAKSVPRLLKDYGLRDARGDYFQETSDCTTASADCLKYHTLNTPTNSGNVLDYIFTQWGGATSNVDGFTTIADTSYYSDHKMIAARLKFAP